jgi:hypothetical protein
MSGAAARIGAILGAQKLGRVGIEIRVEVIETAALSEFGLRELSPILPPDETRLTTPEHTQ